MSDLDDDRTIWRMPLCYNTRDKNIIKICKGEFVVLDNNTDMIHCRLRSFTLLRKNYCREILLLAMLLINVLDSSRAYEFSRLVPLCEGRVNWVQYKL